MKEGVFINLYSGRICHVISNSTRSDDSMKSVIGHWKEEPQGSLICDSQPASLSLGQGYDNPASDNISSKASILCRSDSAL